MRASSLVSFFRVTSAGGLFYASIMDFVYLGIKEQSRGLGLMVSFESVS